MWYLKRLGFFLLFSLAKLLPLSDKACMSHPCSDTGRIVHPQAASLAAKAAVCSSLARSKADVDQLGRMPSLTLEKSSEKNAGEKCKNEQITIGFFCFLYIPCIIWTPVPQVAQLPVQKNWWAEENGFVNTPGILSLKLVGRKIWHRRRVLNPSERWQCFFRHFENQQPDSKISSISHLLGKRRMCSKNENPSLN